MRRSSYSGGDFSSAPLLVLLPVKGSLHELSALAPSLYARLEKVQALMQNGQSSDAERQAFALEESMLKQVLERVSTMLSRSKEA